MGDPTAPRSPRWGVFALKLLLTAAVTLFIVRQVGVDLDELSRVGLSGFRIRWVPLLASAVALGSGYAMSAGLWGKMVHELGGPRIPPRESIPLFMTANLGRYVPGKVVQIAGLALLARERGVPAPVAAGAAILGQGVALLGATLVGMSAFLSPALPSHIRLGGWIGLVLTWAFIVVTSFQGPARRLEALWFGLARRAGTGLAPPEGDEPVLKRRFGLRWTLWYAMNWGLYATAFWLLYMGLVGFQPFLYVAPAFAAAYVGGYIVLFAPAGLGVREVLLGAFLAPVLAAEPALALAVVARLWTTVVEVLPAAVMAPGVLRRRERGPAPGTNEAREGEKESDDGP